MICLLHLLGCTPDTGQQGDCLRALSRRNTDIRAGNRRNLAGVVLLVNGGAVKPRQVTVIAVCAGVLATACVGSSRPASTGSPHRSPAATRQVLFGFGDYEDADANGTRMVRLDPVTLREQPFSTLKLGDSVSGHVFSPDRKSLAFGTVNDRHVVVADLVGYRVAARVDVGGPYSSGWPVEVSVVAWPRADRLLAYTEQFAAHTSYPAQLVVVDPVGRRLIRTAALGGSVLATAVLDDGRAVFLIAPAAKVGLARLVVADPDGRLRWITLRETPAGFGPGRDETPALAVVGTAAYVVGNSERIAQVDLDTGLVRYRAVPGLLGERRADGSPVDPGSGGIMWSDERHIRSVGDGLLSVGGYDTRPAERATKDQYFARSEQIVDTASWTVRRTLHGVTDLVAAHGLYYCWSGSSPYGASNFVGLRPDGTVAFRRTTRDAAWEIVAGRVFENKDGTANVELDPLTGRVLRRVPASLPEPLDLVPWTRP
jgi:hypothetical protein